MSDPGVVEYVDFPIYHQQLQSALRFTLADLELNRSGRLSDSQRRVLLHDESMRIVAMFISVAVAIGGFVIGLGLGITTELSLRILLLVGLAVVVTVGLGVASYKLWRDIRGGAVACVEGFVSPAEEESRVSSTNSTPGVLHDFYWVIDQQRFRVKGAAYGALTPARHRLYFLPLSRRLVAAEPMPRDSLPEQR